MFQNLFRYEEQQEAERMEREKRTLIQDEALIEDLKKELKHFERMMRVFELTYLDMT